MGCHYNIAQKQGLSMSTTVNCQLSASDNRCYILLYMSTVYCLLSTVYVRVYVHVYVYVRVYVRVRASDLSDL